MMKHLVAMGFASALGVAAAPALGQSDDPVNVAVCGASPGGLWSLVGAGMDAALKAESPGSTITYQSSSGGLANVVQVKAGTCQLGMANDGDLIYAKNGTGPFEGEAVEGLHALAVLYDWAPVWWIARADWAEEHGIESIADIAEKQPPVRLVFNRRGLLTSAITEETLKVVGVTLEDIETWGGEVQFQASNEQTKLMRDGRVDLLANTLFEGHRTIAEMADAVDLKLLGTPDEAAEAVIDLFQLKPWTLAPGSVPGQEEPVETVTTSIILFADASLPDDVAYRITKAMIDNPERMGAVSAAMQRFTPEGMTGQNAAPFHPGALRAYQEAGLM